MNVLIVPDKFKGSLTAPRAARAIARGWLSARPGDRLDLLPMSDGGDGFGEILGRLLGARRRGVASLDAAHRPIRAPWWWCAGSKTAIVDSAGVIGLATLPRGEFHPFQLDTFGLGKVLLAAAGAGAAKCVVGIGGSSTNDGGFGLARALGWRFLDTHGCELDEWWKLPQLAAIRQPPLPFHCPLVVAADALNPLLGRAGCTRVYGPQKGLRPQDFLWAEHCLRRLASLAPSPPNLDLAGVPGAGAAGGLGFGLMAFAGGKVKPGFDFFARHVQLDKRVRAARLVITGEGAIDAQTRMGKGVGQIARCCARLGVPCVGLAGTVDPSIKVSNLFVRACALTEITTPQRAQSQAARFLALLAAETARRVC